MNHSSQYTLHDVWVVGQPGCGGCGRLRGDRGACVSVCAAPHESAHSIKYVCNARVPRCAPESASARPSCSGSRAAAAWATLVSFMALQH